MCVVGGACVQYIICVYFMNAENYVEYIVKGIVFFCMCDI